ncbi:MAG: WhiB family transcriptional regulator [Acidimicrobiia bacterium]|nr:WhiB family transcriptional regulator [Acidimicrobiia bacterium]
MKSWREQAACRDAAAELFFPVRGHTDVEIEAAKRVCATCPVQRECLEFALLSHEEFGIWGGTTGRERRRMRKVMARSDQRVAAPV